MKLDQPITVYTLYKYDVWIDPNSYEQKLMITSLHPKYRAKLVREAVELINLEDISNLEGTLTYNAISIIKNATDFESNPTLYIGYVNCIFTALLKQRISYLDIKTFEILTDGSVEF